MGLARLELTVSVAGGGCCTNSSSSLAPRGVGGALVSSQQASLFAVPGAVVAPPASCWVQPGTLTRVSAVAAVAAGSAAVGAGSNGQSSPCQRTPLARPGLASSFLFRLLQVKVLPQIASNRKKLKRRAP